MKEQSRKPIISYLSEQFVGRFTGFVIALSATRVVSHFFTTPSIHNLWGLTAKKTVVSRQTFANLQWVAAVLIGYIVFEVVLRIIKSRIGPSISRMRFRLRQIVIERGWVRNKMLR